MRSIFQKKEGYRLRKIVEFFKKYFVLETAWFGSICSENTIIELSFEIEVVFFEETNTFVGVDFSKKEGYRLGKIVDFFQKKFCSRKILVWFYMF